MSEKTRKLNSRDDLGNFYTGAVDEWYFRVIDGDDDLFIGPMSEQEADVLAALASERDEARKWANDANQLSLRYERERDEAVRERDDYRTLVVDLLPHVNLAILPGPLDARLVKFVDSLTHTTGRSESRKGTEE